MEPNKFEEHIKVAFNKRTINPSDSAWDRISGQIEGNPIVKKHPWYKIAVAAGLIGVFIGLLLYYNRETPTENVDNTIVNTTDKSDIFDRDITPQIIENTKTEVADNQNQNTVGKTTTKAEYRKKEIPDKAIAIVDNSDDKPQNITGVENTVQQKLIAIKISGVVAKVAEIEQHYNTVTVREIDSLIKQAEEELLRSKLFMPDNAVNAEALLAEVENELEEPLKTKLYKLLKKGIIEARTVIADREN